MTEIIEADVRSNVTAIHPRYNFFTMEPAEQVKYASKLATVLSEERLNR